MTSNRRERPDATRAARRATRRITRAALGMTLLASTLLGHLAAGPGRLAPPAPRSPGLVRPAHPDPGSATPRDLVAGNGSALALSVARPQLPPDLAARPAGEGSKPPAPALNRAHAPVSSRLACEPPHVAPAPWRAPPRASSVASS